MKFGNGANSASNLKVTLKIQINQRNLSQDFIVYENLPCDMLFGLDFLRNSMMIMRFRDNIIEYEDSVFAEHLPVNMIGENQRHISKVWVTEKVLLPPMSSKDVLCYCYQCPYGTALFEPRVRFQDMSSELRLENTLTNITNHKLHIPVHNVSARPILLREQVLGHIDFNIENGVFMSDSYAEQNKSITTKEKLELLNYNKELTEYQLKSLKCLCVKYENIFATCLEDIKGLTYYSMRFALYLNPTPFEYHHTELRKRKGKR
ncbi:hypothetical protein HDE_05254 [Halotydeus destructor]|nr:hypothetical protein HDE_05254 [Halotydeus destructor]